MAKGLFPTLGPEGVVSFRTLFAALVLIAIVRPAFTRLTRTQWAAVVPYGVTLGTMNICIYLAMARIPLGLAVTLEFLGPLALAVLGSRGPKDFFWVILAGAGIALLAPWSVAGNDDALDPWGIALALGAGGCWAAYIVIGSQVSRRLPHGEGVAVGMAVAALALLPFCFPHLVSAPVTPAILAKGLGVAVLSSALPYYLEMTALRVLPHHTFGILMSLEPAVAALMGSLFLHERLSGLQWTAVACVSAASAGSSLTAKRAVAPEVL